MTAPLQPVLRGELRLQEPMSAHTSWRVGGPADRFYQPADLDDLAGFLASLPVEEPLLWLGLGSNLLVRDGGIRGTVVFTLGALDELHRVGGRTNTRWPTAVCRHRARNGSWARNCASRPAT
ncbi:MAG: hypothetical protein LC646_01370 [Xanthomonadaceae bacterium]|nr:hypothetical protein [Xanthomonadaceae bacterium]